MSAAVQTTVTDLPDSRVRVQVQVGAEEVGVRLQRKAGQLGHELKLPGFRRGKVPAPLVLQRIGREAVLEQAVRESLSSWYAQAVEQANIVPVGDPTLDVDFVNLPADGEPFRFSIEIGVLPQAQLGEYQGIEVPRREPTVDDAVLDREVEGIRERLARLETVDRAAARGDFVVIDYVGSLREAGDGEGPAASEPAASEPFPGGEGRDQLVELGGGNLIPGFEEQLLGASADEQRTVELTFPGDYPNEELAGRDARFAVTVKEVKLKELPEIGEDLAIDAGFDSVQELRDDIRERLLAAEELRVEAEFRDAALDAAVAHATLEVPAELVKARAREMWERTLHSLSHRGISREAYLQIAGRSEEEILADTEPDAELALRREAVLTAVVAAEGIEPTEEQLREALAPVAEREGLEVGKLLEQLRSSGRLEDLNEDLAARLAVELIAERAKPISVAQAQARDSLWTPEKAAAEQAAEGERAAAGAPVAGAGKLWTPADP